MLPDVVITIHNWRKSEAVICVLQLVPEALELVRILKNLHIATIGHSMQVFFILNIYIHFISSGRSPL